MRLEGVIEVPVVLKLLLLLLERLLRLKLLLWLLRLS